MTSLAFTLVAQLALTAAVPAASPATPEGRQKQPLVCTPPPVTSLDRPFTLRCTLGTGVNAAAVVLYFRQGGARDFTAAPALRTKPGAGAFTAALCAHDVVAGPLQYYFEAQDGAGKVVASDGDEESPSVLVVAPATVVRPVVVAAAAAAAPATGVAHQVSHAHSSIGDDNDPLAAVRRQQDASRRADQRSRRRQPGPLVGGALGVGYGYYGERTLDFNRDLASDPSTGLSGLPLLLPELGWQIDDRWAATVQLRWQPLDPGGAGDPRLGSPAKRSWAIIARGHYQFGESRLRPFVNANVGVGDGFRLVVPANPAEGLLRDDTIRGGPFVAGPGGGVLYHFNPFIALSAELRVMGGLPNFAVVSELSAGAQLGF